MQSKQRALCKCASITVISNACARTLFSCHFRQQPLSRHNCCNFPINSDVRFRRSSITLMLI
uniref:Secreted protein n=1 Tax=Ascaris lumbricoides TaxID=6252 RepID=A0A0M3I7P5_ASCLU